MRTLRLFVSIYGLLMLGSLIVPASVVGQFEGEQKVVDSIEVLNEIMQISTGSIPRAMLADAQAVAIVPRVIKGSFIVGARKGEGVILIRDGQGNWQAPAFVTLAGGNIGWQIGVQSTDLVLVFKTRTSVEQMIKGKLTIGADAAAAAGPVGRDAAIATDNRLRAEIYSYSRSRGLFAGVSVDGSVLKMDPTTTSAYYQPMGANQPAQIPESAVRLTQLLVAYMGEQVPLVDPASTRGVELAPPSAATAIPQVDVEVLRSQLANAAQTLNRILDGNWQKYLALPAEVYAAGQHPAGAQLAECLMRYDVVRTNNAYQQLFQREEFQSTYSLLQQYHSAVSSQRTTLELPSPPIVESRR